MAGRCWKLGIAVCCPACRCWVPGVLPPLRGIQGRDSVGASGIHTRPVHLILFVVKRLNSVGYDTLDPNTGNPLPMAMPSTRTGWIRGPGRGRSLAHEAGHAHQRSGSAACVEFHVVAAGRLALELPPRCSPTRQAQLVSHPCLVWNGHGDDGLCSARRIRQQRVCSSRACRPRRHGQLN